MAPTRRALPLLGMVAVALGGSVADAKRIALLEVRGPDRGAVRAALLHSLRETHTVIPQSRLEAKLAELGLALGRCAQDQVSSIAAAARADAVLCGAVSGPRRSRTLVLRVYNGGDGALVKTLRIRLGASLAGARRAGAALEPGLATTWSWEPVEVKRRPRAERVHVFDPSVAALPDSATWELGDSENPLSSRRARASRAPAAVVRAAARSTARGPEEHALRISVGPSLLFRRSYRVYNPATPADGQGWVTTPAAGLALAAELYPGAWLTQGWGSKLGIGVSYTRHFGIAWKMNSDPAEHSATHQVLAADARARIRLWKSVRAPVLLLKAGYHRLDFSMNGTPGVPAVIPDVSFSSVDLGVGAQVALWPRWLHIVASFDYLPVLARGEIATADEYGAASGNGMLFAGGLRGAIRAGFGWRLDVEYAWYTVSFAQASSSRRKAEMARDRYLSSLLCVTYSN